MNLKLKAADPKNEFINSLIWDKLKPKSEASKNKTAEDTVSEDVATDTTGEWENEAEWDRYYKVEGGKIILNNDLLQQTEVSTLLVYLRALLQTEKLQELVEFKSVRTVREAAQKLTEPKAWADFRAVFARQIKQPEKEFEGFTAANEAVKQSVDSLYLVVPDHDAEAWQEVLKRCPNQPKGVLIYDGEKVKLENFASRHSGDQNQMTQILRSVIPRKEAADGGIDYGEFFLGKTMAETARTGNRQQVLRESDTEQRKNLTWATRQEMRARRQN